MLLWLLHDLLFLRERVVITTRNGLFNSEFLGGIQTLKYEVMTALDKIKRNKAPGQYEIVSKTVK